MSAVQLRLPQTVLGAAEVSLLSSIAWSTSPGTTVKKAAYQRPATFTLTQVGSWDPTADAPTVTFSWTQTADSGMPVGAIAMPMGSSSPAWKPLTQAVRVAGHGKRTVKIHVVAVRVDASLEEGWFYEGAGIYLYNARSSDAAARTQWERAQSVLAGYDGFEFEI